MRRVALWSAILGFCLTALIGCVLATPVREAAPSLTATGASFGQKPAPPPDASAIGPAFVVTGTGVAQAHAALHFIAAGFTGGSSHDAIPRRQPRTHVATPIRSLPLRI